MGELDFSLMTGQYQEALAMIPEEYENHQLYSFIFNVDNDDEVTTVFTIEATLKGEDTEQEGRMEVTNYYEFDFNGDAAGGVVANE